MLDGSRRVVSPCSFQRLMLSGADLYWPTDYLKGDKLAMRVNCLALARRSATR